MKQWRIGSITTNTQPKVHTAELNWSISWANQHHSLCVSTPSSNRQEVFAGCQQASVTWLITAPERQPSVPKTALRWTANPATTGRRATAMTASVPRTSTTAGGCSAQVTHTPLTGWAEPQSRHHHHNRTETNLEMQVWFGDQVWSL